MSKSWSDGVKRQFARADIELKEDEMAVIDALGVLEDYVNSNLRQSVRMTQ